MKGKENVLPDGLSRWEQNPEEASAVEVEEARQYIHNIAVVMAWMDQVPKLPISRSNIVRAQKADLHLGRIRDILNLKNPLHPSEIKGELPEVKQLLRIAPDLHIKDDVLLLETSTQMDQVTGRSTNIVLPKAVWDLAFELSHGLTGSGHFGFGPCLSRAKVLFYREGRFLLQKSF